MCTLDSSVTWWSLCVFTNLVCGLVHLVSDCLKCSCGHEPRVMSRSERQLQHHADLVMGSSLCRGECASISFFFLSFVCVCGKGRRGCRWWLGTVLSMQACRQENIFHGLQTFPSPPFPPFSGDMNLFVSSRWQKQ